MRTLKTNKMIAVVAALIFVFSQMILLGWASIDPSILTQSQSVSTQAETSYSTSTGTSTGYGTSTSSSTYSSSSTNFSTSSNTNTSTVTPTMPFKAMAATNPDTQKNLTISVDATNKATVTWNTTTYTGQYTRESNAIVITLPGADASKIETWSLVFSASSAGMPILTRFEDRCVFRNTGTVSIATYSFYGNGLLATMSSNYSSPNYRSWTSTSYTYTTVAGKSLVSYVISSSNYTNISSGVSYQGQSYSRGYFQYNATGNQIGAVSAFRNIVNGQTTYSASYNKVDSAKQTRTYASVSDVNLLGAITSWQAHGMIDQYAKTRTVSYYTNVLTGEGYQYVIQEVSQKDPSGATVFVARKMQMADGTVYILQGDTKILFKIGQLVNGYTVSYGEAYEYNGNNANSTYLGYGLVFSKYTVVNDISQQTVVVVDYPTQKTVTFDGKTYDIVIDANGVVTLKELVAAVEPMAIAWPYKTLEKVMFQGKEWDYVVEYWDAALTNLKNVEGAGKLMRTENGITYLITNVDKEGNSVPWMDPTEYSTIAKVPSDDSMRAQMLAGLSASDLEKITTQDVYIWKNYYDSSFEAQINTVYSLTASDKSFIRSFDVNAEAFSQIAVTETAVVVSELNPQGVVVGSTECGVVAGIPSNVTIENPSDGTSPTWPKQSISLENGKPVLRTTLPMPDSVNGGPGGWEFRTLNSAKKLTDQQQKDATWDVETYFNTTTKGPISLKINLEPKTRNWYYYFQLVPVTFYKWNEAAQQWDITDTRITG